MNRINMSAARCIALNLLRTTQSQIFKNQTAFIATKANPHHPLYAKYMKYQIDDGTPVHLKGGFGDQILYKATILLVVFGLYDGLTTIYGMAFKKKK